MSRLPTLDTTTLEGERKALFEAITSGKRSHDRPLAAFLNDDRSLRGPFNPLLFSPAIGHTLQRLGEQLRYEGALPDRLREVAILTVAAHWRANYEWWAHERIAVALGTGTDILDALRTGNEPAAASEAERAASALVRETLRTGRASDAVYARAHAALGDAETVELVVLAGYYGIIAMVLNVFEIDVPGESQPFD